MKLLEVIQPLLENKVDHIANNQTKKIWDRLIDDESVELNWRTYDETTNNMEYVYHKADQTYDLIFNMARLAEEYAGEYEEFDVTLTTIVGLHFSDSILLHKDNGIQQNRQIIEDSVQEVIRHVVQWMSDNISKKYLQWVVNQYIAAGSDENPANDFALAEDYQMIADSLKIYHQMKSEIGVPLTNKVSTADLFELVEPYRQAMDAEAAKAKEKELLARGEIEIPFSQGPKELVIIPKTFEASHYLSEPNGWCTQYKNWFEDYTKDGRVLYYFRHQGKPHLVHFESGQFMKKGNRPFDLKSVRESSPAFQWVIEQKKKEVENMQDDDPSSAAYEMVRDGFAELEWAMKVIENDKTGDSSDAAYLMVRDGYTEPEWAMRIIQNAKTGNPSGVAYMMVVDGYTEPEWAMKVIENAKTGNPSGVAYWMVRDGHTNDTEWAMKVIENAKTGNPSGGAYAMVRDGHTKDTEWAMKVIENATTGDPSYVAYRMVRDGHAPQEWYDRNFG